MTETEQRLDKILRNIETITTAWLSGNLSDGQAMEDINDQLCDTEYEPECPPDDEDGYTPLLVGGVTVLQSRRVEL